jgi:hypothetical protein
VQRAWLTASAAEAVGAQIATKARTHYVHRGFKTAYSGIPHTPTNDKLTARCTLCSTLDDKTKPFYDTLIG